MPDGPIGTRESRVRKALHWYWTRDMTQEEIGEKLGVSRQKVSEYICQAPQSEAVQEQLDRLETEVRYIAVEELRRQLKQAGERARTAEKPIKIWQDEDGGLIVQDEHDEHGNLTGRYPVPAGFEMGPDEEKRFYGRNEVREILDLLMDIVGAKAAEQHEITGDGGGPVEVVVNEEMVETDWEE